MAVWYSYEHGWSVHCFLYSHHPAKYRAFIARVRKKMGPDLTEDLKRVFGMDVDELNTRWKKFMDGLKAPPARARK